MHIHHINNLDHITVHLTNLMIHKLITREIMIIIIIIIIYIYLYINKHIPRPDKVKPQITLSFCSFKAQIRIHYIDSWLSLPEFDVGVAQS